MKPVWGRTVAVENPARFLFWAPRTYRSSGGACIETIETKHTSLPDRNCAYKPDTYHT